MSSHFVETITAGFIRQMWPTEDVEAAEVVARRLSVAAINDPTYPNPFFVIELNGKSPCHYFAGARQTFPNLRETKWFCTA